jgi:hypothetical protein
VSAPVEPWEFELAGISDKQYDRDTKGSAAGIKQQRLPSLPDDELEFAQFAWAWTLTPAHHAAYLATTSMVIAMTPQEREEHLNAARSQLQRVCDATGSKAMPIRHDASCVRWTPKPCPG